MTIRVNDAHAIRLIAEASQVPLENKIYSIAHYNSNDKLTGGVLITDNNGYSCEMHSANFVNEGGRRELFWAIFNYVFKVLKVKKVFGRVPEWNRSALRLNYHIGFKDVALIPDVFKSGEGLQVMAMEEQDCMVMNIKPKKLLFAPFIRSHVVEIPQYTFVKLKEGESHG